jgi:2-(1,2-epoxy-1,2-dihydrophenyl)acetyl-CoA isomerase
MTQIGYDCRNRIGWITLREGDRGNAFTADVADELFAAVWAAERDGAVVLVLRAEGRFFSVGGDLTGFADTAILPEVMDDLTSQAHRIISHLTRSDLVVLSAVQGTAAGIGFPLAMAADLVVAADTARFTLGYTKVGLTGDGGTGLLVRSIGLHRTLRLALLNDVLTAEDAYAMGLLARVFPAAELDAGVAELAAHLATGSRGAQAGIKRIVRAAALPDLETQLALEARTMTAATRDSDALEGVSAFLAKRPARFRGAAGVDSAG